MGILRTLPLELTETGFITLAARYARLNKKQDEEENTSVIASMRAQRADEGRQIISFGEVVKQSIANKEWEFFTTKADVLHSYEHTHKNPYATLVLNFRKADKLLTTYIQPMYDRCIDGLVHGSFGITATVGGRLNSSDPNLQNIPPAAKPAYTSRFGLTGDAGHLMAAFMQMSWEEYKKLGPGVILSADYSQIELRCAASLFDDPEMIGAYQRGEDVHAQTAGKIYTPSEGEPSRYEDCDATLKKKWRVRAKRTNFGTIYGIGSMGLQVTLRKDGVFISLAEAEELLNAFKRAKPVLFRNMGRLQERAQRDGVVVSETGRYRRLPEVFSNAKEIVARALRQGTNFVVQSWAADLTLMALVAINRILKAEGFKSVLILTVHDSLVFDCVRSEAVEVARIAKAVMEHINELSDDILPGCKWNKLQVPLVAEMEVGVNWSACAEFDPDDLDDGNRSDTPLHWLDERGKLMMRKPVTENELWELVAVKGRKSA